MKRLLAAALIATAFAPATFAPAPSFAMVNNGGGGSDGARGLTDTDRNGPMSRPGVRPARTMFQRQSDYRAALRNWNMRSLNSSQGGDPRGNGFGGTYDYGCYCYDND